MTDQEPDSADPNEPGEGEYLDFPMPKGLELPEGSKDGSEVDMLATFSVKGDKLCLTAVEGIPIEGAAQAGHEQPPEDFAGAVEQGL
jgi:hypothetical protein